MDSAFCVAQRFLYPASPFRLFCFASLDAIIVATHLCGCMCVFVCLPRLPVFCGLLCHLFVLFIPASISFCSYVAGEAGFFGLWSCCSHTPNFFQFKGTRNTRKKNREQILFSFVTPSFLSPRVNPFLHQCAPVTWRASICMT